MTQRPMRLVSAFAIACAAIQAPAGFAQDGAPLAETQTANADAAALRELLASSEADFLDRNPIAAFYRGDFSMADQLGDWSPASYEAERAAADANLAALVRIDRSALSAGDRIAYDTFRYSNERTLAGTEGEVLEVVLATPIDHFRGIQGDYPSFSAPDGVMPFETPEDYANNIARHTA